MNVQPLNSKYHHVMGAVRTTASVLLLAMAAVCYLVYANIFYVTDSYNWASLPLCIALTALATVQGLWSPYTKQKISAYLYATLILGSLVAVLITGFSTLVYLAWTALELVVIMYFSARRAIVNYFVLLGSLYVWLALHLDHHHRGEVLTHYLAAISVGILAGLFAAVWRLMNQSIKDLEASNVREDIERSQLTSLVNSMADGVIAVDAEAKVVLYNAAALNVLDLNSSMTGKSLKRFIHLYDKDQQPIDIVKLVLETKLANVSRDYLIKYSDSSLANLYLSIAPVHLGYGKQGSQGFVLLLRDITREKSLEEERDEFISVVSHELRTPIAISEGNISNAQLLASKAGKGAELEKVQTALDEAHDQILFLSDMINDLATLSRAERGKLVLEVETIDVTRLLHDLEATYRPEASAKGLKLSVVADKTLQPLTSSRLYVHEVLQNFITNAIKYTETGGVTIAVSQTPKDTIFKVSDTGIGISKGDQERVFDKFFRSEDYRTRQNNGTGLGLYVTMKLTRLIHADIDLESELNKGSTFRITVPNIH